MISDIALSPTYYYLYYNSVYTLFLKISYQLYKSTMEIKKLFQQIF